MRFTVSYDNGTLEVDAYTLAGAKAIVRNLITMGYDDAVIIDNDLD